MASQDCHAMFTLLLQQNMGANLQLLSYVQTVGYPFWPQHKDSAQIVHLSSQYTHGHSVGDGQPQCFLTLYLAIVTHIIEL